MWRDSAKKVLFLILFLLFVTSSLLHAEEAKKYPPYPDVWGYEFPWPEENRRDSGIRVYKLPDDNYNYIVSYMKKIDQFKRKDGSCCDHIIQRESVSFFSGKALTEDEDKKIKKKPIKYEQIVFNNGSLIEQETAGLSRCADQLDRHILKKDKNGNVIMKKMLLYLNDKPIKRHIPVNPHCERNWDYNENKDYISERVANVYAQFVPLEDDTFLLYDSFGNIIVRFDKDFNTKSGLMNKRVFLIDEKVIRELRNKSKGDDQSQNDAIYKYLLNLKKGGKK